MYSRLVRIQQNKADEGDVHNSIQKQQMKARPAVNRLQNKSTLYSDDSKSLNKIGEGKTEYSSNLRASNTLKLRTEECRRTLNVFNINNIGVFN